MTLTHCWFTPGILPRWARPAVDRPAVRRGRIPPVTTRARAEEGQGLRVHPYRWVVLAVVTLVNLAIQILWIGYAPITGPAAEFYGVSDVAVGLFSMAFMLAFIPLSLPASWLIDTRGFRFAVGLGSIVMGACGILRGLAGSNYALAMLATAGIAAAQPLLLNSWTKMPARWFAPGQRATAVGIITLGNLLGTGIGMVASPILIESMPIDRVQLVYGVAAAAAAALFVALAREHPPTPAGPPGDEVRALVLDGLRHALRVREFWAMLAIAFVGLGVFNGLTTWIEAIIRPRGFTPTDAGTLGAVLLVGGLAGAVLLPALSDRSRRRGPFLVLAFAGATPGLLGVTFAPGMPVLLLSGAVLGFFLVSALPVGFQYAAEVTRPTPEGTSAGLMQLFGQGAVVFVYLMSALRTPDGSFTRALLVSLALLAAAAVVASRLPEPHVLDGAAGPPEGPRAGQ
jgi:MFS family permease